MITVGWDIFQIKYLPHKEIFVLETDDSWVLYTSSEGYKIKCIVEKSAEQGENIIFLERYFHNKPNITKVLDTDDYIEEVEPMDEEPREVAEDGDGFE